MEIAIWLVGAIACVVLVAAVCDRVGIPAPLALVVVGVALSFAPFIPDYALDPEIVLIGILPPLLYSAAYNTSFIELKDKQGTIASLSVGLVIATTLTVGFTVWYLLPGIPLAAALALGAVVAPPDAVAALAIARRVGLPTGVIRVLEGESLVNDATALTALRSALAALAGALTIAEVGVDFIVAAAGGAVVGAIVALAVGRLFRLLGRLTEDLAIATAAGFVVPYLAYLPAEAFHASGVIAVVVAGLIMGHHGQRYITGAERLTANANWQTVSFLLENGVFLLIGLELYGIVSAVIGGPVDGPQVALLCGAAFLVTIVTRFVWVYATAVLAALPWFGRASSSVDWRAETVVGWAAMRGVVTIAAALILPLDVPNREVLIVVALFVVIASLLLQGSTIPWLVRRLRLRPPDRGELALQEALLFDSAANVALESLAEGDNDLDHPRVMDRLRSRVADRRNAMWERASLGSPEDTPTRQYLRLRLAMLQIEREEVLRQRDHRSYDDEVIRSALRRLDLEQAMLDQPWTEHEAREEDLAPTHHTAGTCEHLDAAEALPVPQELICDGCVADGTRWVRLRMCLECGYRGCCDSSEQRHAEAHYLATGHPVMRTIEVGEAWRWCFVHEILGR